jgi:hypothetical protein
MHVKRTLALYVATLAVVLALVPGALAAGGTTVTVRVEGLNRTLLATKTVTTHTGWITKYGAPKGDCPAMSAQGALDGATRHRWVGTWSTKYGPEYEITSILGETHSFSSTDFWDIFVNNVPASAGACELNLHPGEQLLFAAVPDSGTAYPLALTAPASVTAGHSFTVKVVWFNGGGKSKPLAGARVSGIGVQSALTNSRGLATIVDAHVGALVLHAGKKAAKKYYVRAAATLRVS